MQLFYLYTYILRDLVKHTPPTALLTQKKLGLSFVIYFIIQIYYHRFVSYNYCHWYVMYDNDAFYTKSNIVLYHYFPYTNEAGQWSHRYTSSLYTDTASYYILFIFLKDFFSSWLAIRILDSLDCVFNKIKTIKCSVQDIFVRNHKTVSLIWVVLIWIETKVVITTNGNTKSPELKYIYYS